MGGQAQAFLDFHYFTVFIVPHLWTTFLLLAIVAPLDLVGPRLLFSNSVRACLAPYWQSKAHKVIEVWLQSYLCPSSIYRAGLSWIHCFVSTNLAACCAHFNFPYKYHFVFRRSIAHVLACLQCDSIQLPSARCNFRQLDVTSLHRHSH